MSITIKPEAGYALPPIALTKYRENSKDSIVYIHNSHTVEEPRLVTVTSELPTPRKGNLGTVKTTVNSRWTVNIAKEGEPANFVPVIAKLQTSFPVGSGKGDMQDACHILQNLMAQSDDEFVKLFYTGILPQD